MQHNPTSGSAKNGESAGERRGASGLAILAERVLGETTSVCSRCLAPVPATIFTTGEGVFLRKRCETHGEEIALESSSLDFYHVVSEKRCCGPDDTTCLPPAGEPGSLFETAPEGPSCVLLLEITDSCNLECPLCFAASGPAGRYFMALEEAQRRIDGAVARRGAIDILMLSGGEPTAHPKFAALLELAENHPAIGRVMVNTNGVLLSRTGAARDGITRYRAKTEVYLQFDSVDSERTAKLRGEGDLVGTKQRALDWLDSEGLPVTLASVLSRESSVADIRTLLQLALSRRHVRGVTFQPAFASGRHHAPFDPLLRLTTPDAIELVCAALPDHFSKSGFTNLPCSHPNCAIVAYYFREGEKLWPLCEKIEPLESLKNRINFTLEDLKLCGCEHTELGRYVRSAELSADRSFRIVIKPFMDRFNLNRDRTKQCCTHVAGPDGRLMSFCEYNIHRELMGWNRDAPRGSE